MAQMAAEQRLGGAVKGCSRTSPLSRVEQNICLRARAMGRQTTGSVSTDETLSPPVVPESLAVIRFYRSEPLALTSYLHPMVRVSTAVVKINLRLSSCLEYRQSKQTGLNNTIYTTYQLH